MSIGFANLPCRNRHLANAIAIVQGDKIRNLIFPIDRLNVSEPLILQALRAFDEKQISEYIRLTPKGNQTGVPVLVLQDQHRISRKRWGGEL